MTLGALGVALGSRRALFGRGDVHLCPLLGAMGGWFDPGAVVSILVVASVAGAVCALIVMFSRVGRPGYLIPYGPFLMFGTMVAMVLSIDKI
jgi:leader peptidase (prepilin peptidase)/N-methyltransferase